MCYKRSLFVAGDATPKLDAVSRRQRGLSGVGAVLPRSFSIPSDRSNKVREEQPESAAMTTCVQFGRQSEEAET